MTDVVVHDREGDESVVSSKDLVFRPSVYGLLFQDNKILLSPQWSGYDFPGGGVNIEETLTEALEREFREETGLTVRVGSPIHSGTTFYAPGASSSHAGEYWNVVYLYYLVEATAGTLSTEFFDEDEKEYTRLAEWIDVDSVTRLKFFNSVDSPAVIKKGFAAFSQ